MNRSDRRVPVQCTVQLVLKQNEAFDCSKVFCATMNFVPILIAFKCDTKFSRINLSSEGKPRVICVPRQVVHFVNVERSIEEVRERSHFAFENPSAYCRRLCAPVLQNQMVEGTPV